MTVIEKIDLILNEALNEARDTKKGKGVTRDEANVLYKRLKSAIRPDMTQQLSKYGKPETGEWWDLHFRAYDFFTSRPGEEDDDWPNFTGGKQLDKILRQHVIGIGYQVDVSEKSWFSIDDKAKKMTKKDQRLDARKEKETVWRELHYAEMRADRYDKEKYNETAAVLKKMKTKFIKKDKFFELATKTNWRWDKDDLENFWGDIK